MERKIVFEHSLQTFFFDQLSQYNQKSTRPLPNEVLFYSSFVLDKFGLSKEYFDVDEDGRFQEKILGIKFLEMGQLGRDEQEKRLKEIAETALFLCGFFSESVERKITDLSYYQTLGKTAYQRLNNLIPAAYEITDFYTKFSHLFESVTNLMNILSSNLKSPDQDDSFLLFSNVDIKVS